MSSVRRRTGDRAAGRVTDNGMTLIEVVVAFVILLIALIPLSYLFTTSLIQAGQSKNQVQALSIAEKWTEILSNVTPPVNSYGEVIVDTNNAPVGPAAGSTSTTAAYSVPGAGSTPSTLAVAGTTTMAVATAANPQTASVTTSVGQDSITYTGQTYSGLNIVSLTGVTGWSQTETIANGAAITQTTAVTATESKGNITYSLQAEYEWTSIQTGTTGSTTIASGSNNVALPVATINVASTSNFATSGSAKVTTSAGTQAVSYTGITSTSLTGVSGGTGTMSTGGAVVQRTSKPNLCTSGTPQLLKLRVTVGWGPNTDVNNVQDSIILNYPPAGIQTLGFIALQLNGDTTANDSQGDPWSERVQAPPVQITQTSGGSQNLTVYPDNYGCAFAQVNPGTYTVAVANASSGTPGGTTYGTPSFVANGAGATATSGTLQTTPATTLTVGSTAGFPASGTLAVVHGGITYKVTCTGTTATTFTGCTLASGGPVTLSGGDPVSVLSGNVVQQPVQEQQAGIPVSIGAVTNLTATYPTAYPGYDQGSIINLTYPSSSAVDDGVACPGAGSITCVATGQNSAGAVLTWASQQTWSNVSVPGTVSRIASVACAASVECVGVGYGGGNGVILDGSTGPGPTASAAPNSAAALTGVTSLSQVVCPSNSNCVAIGTTATGAAVLSDTITGGVDAWSAVTLPANVVGLTSLVCPSGGTGCAALGTTSTPANGTPIVVSGGFGGPWVADNTFTGFTVSALSALACPSAGTCMATGVGKIGAGATGPIVLDGIASTGLATSALTWTTDTLPTIASTTINALTQITCPPTSSKCLFTGTGTKSAATVPLVLFGPITASATLGNDALPAAVTSVTQTVCPSATVCVSIGAAGAAPAVLSWAVNPAATTADNPTNVSVPGVPGGTLNQLTQVNCPSSSSCAVTAVGTTTATSQPSAYLLASTSGTTIWSPVSLPTANAALYLSDIDCTTSGSPVYCSAVGASATGAVEFSSNGGPSGPWSDQTPSGLSGSVVKGVPVEINNTGLLPTQFQNVVTAGAGANVTQIPDLYPFNAGYGLFAGDCSAELGAGSFNVTQANTTPGGSSGASVPLGLVEVQALHASGSGVGLPYSGATVSLTATTSGCGADVYTLPTAGPDGLSRTTVPYGTYTLTVTGASATSVAVTVGGSSQVAAASTVLFPNPITVSVP
jgi:Tfp pilus assembly protein PilV